MNEIYTVVDRLYTIFGDSGDVLYQDNDFCPTTIDCAANDSSYVVASDGKDGQLVLKEGILDGEAIERNPKNGIITHKCYYSKGLLHGPAKTFFPDATLASVCLYVHGKREGLSLFFKTDSILLAKERYRAGRKHGGQHYFYDSGKKRLELAYEEGVLSGQALYYMENGELFREIGFKNGKRSGFDTMWDRYGTAVFSFEYVDGKIIRRCVADPVALRYQLY